MLRLARAGLVSAACVAITLCLHAQTPPKQPNILLAIADDWSWPHAGAYGDPTVKTPVFDRVAREGVLFTRAFTAAPSCTPSRAALLTGRYPHQLEEGGVLHGFLPAKFPVYTDLLEQAGYYVGFTRKGWGPGRFEPGGRTRNPAGPQFSDFDDVPSRPARGPAVRVLVRQSGSSPALRRRIRCGVGHRPRVDSRAAVPARYAGSTGRSGGLLFRGAALRSRAGRDSRTAASARRARQHARRDDRRQRHAVSTSEGQRVRRRRAHAVGDAVAGAREGRARRRCVHQPERSGTDVSRSGWFDPARLDERAKYSRPRRRRQRAGTRHRYFSSASVMRTFARAICRIRFAPFVPTNGSTFAISGPIDGRPAILRWCSLSARMAISTAACRKRSCSNGETIRRSRGSSRSPPPNVQPKSSTTCARIRTN